MKCPTCPESVLVMADRQGIEIDYCPACRGVWLDRGELDKLIERSAAVPAPQPAQAAPAQQRHPDFVDSDHHPRGRDHHPVHLGYGYAKRRKSWMSEIFD